MKEKYIPAVLEVLAATDMDAIAVSAPLPYETEDNSGYGPVFRP